MLGLQGNTSSPKEYRCVACSATFHGLASLLVHQASHASEVHPKTYPERLPSSAQIGPGFAKKDLSDQQHSATLQSPASSSDQQHSATVQSPASSSDQQHSATVQSPASSTDQQHSATVQSPASSDYICECGCEFKDFNLMLEHKKTHVSKPQQLPSQDIVALSVEGECSRSDPLHSPTSSLQPSLNQSVPACGPPTHSMPPSIHTMPPSTHTTSSISLLLDSTSPVAEADSEGLANLAISPECISLPSPTDQGEHSSGDDLLDCVSPEEPALDNIQVESPEEIIESPEEMSHSDSDNDNLPKNKTIMKMLATAYMKRFQPSQPPRQEKCVIPKTENIPVEISASKSEASLNPASTVGQLRSLLTNSSAKTKDGAASSLSAGHTVPLTKTFCPVVVLETRQKLIDSNNITYRGSYQCGRCRKVFQDSDTLTVHHSTHRKEQVKCCRLCKQLLIGNPSLPDSHICSELSDKASLRSKFTFNKKTFLHQRAKYFKQQQRHQRGLHAKASKLYYCPLCKHSYTRRYNLTKHKCTGHLLSQKQRPQMSTFLHTKSEAIATDLSPGAQLAGVAWSGTPKSFSPFYPRSSKHVTPGKVEESVDVGSVEDGDSALDMAGSPQEDGEWTIPLDDEIEVLVDDGSADDLGDDEPINADTSDVKQQQPMSQYNSKSTIDSLQMPFFIKDGVKRYPCHKCQKTYSRGSTLRRHLRLCGLVRSNVPHVPHVPRAVFGAVHQRVKPMHDCFVCGKSFNRRDNMMVHRRKCQLRRTVGARDNEHQSFSTSKAPSLLGAKREVSDQNQGDNGANWGIMSLPSVLPRRVTCECGVGFTSPQLLLEHLQKHAQESYTCPTCGETLNSWANYELHLQTHMQPHHHGVPLRRSQPLLLRFQQKPQPPSLPQQQFGMKKLSPPVQRPFPNQAPLPRRKPSQQPSVCVRCNNIFSTRSSLLKHLSMNRCKGGHGMNLATANHCSHCNTDFPNVLSLKFHQKSGVCKPGFKPMRCPVCVRWFGTVEGLQKHLITHNQPSSYSCQICQRIYSTLKSLKDHRRKVHRISARDEAVVTEIEDEVTEITI